MTVLVSLALAGLFAATAAGKLTGYAKSIEMRDHLGVAAPLWTQIGLLEVAAAPAVVALALSIATVALQATNL